MCRVCDASVWLVESTLNIRVYTRAHTHTHTYTQQASSQVTPGNQLAERRWFTPMRALSLGLLDDTLTERTTAVELTFQTLSTQLVAGDPNAKTTYERGRKDLGKVFERLNALQPSPSILTLRADAASRDRAAFIRFVGLRGLTPGPVFSSSVRSHIKESPHPLAGLLGKQRDVSRRAVRWSQCRPIH